MNINQTENNISNDNKLKSDNPEKQKNEKLEALLKDYKDKINTYLTPDETHLENNISSTEIKELVELHLDLQSEKQHYQEIEFFTSNDNKQPTIYTLLNENNENVTSQLLLKTLLDTHSIDTTELVKIQHFLKKTAIFNNQLSAVKNLVSLERDIFWFIKSSSTELAEMTQNIYFNKIGFLKIGKVNEQKQFMNYYYYFLMLINPVWTLISPILFMIIPFFFTNIIMGGNISLSAYIETIKNSLFGTTMFTGVAHILNFYILSQTGGTKEGFSALNFFNKIKIFIMKLIHSIITYKYTKYIYLFFVVANYCWGLYMSYSASKTYYKFIKFLFTNMKNLANLLHLANELILLLSTEKSQLPQNILDVMDSTSSILKNPIISEILEQHKYFNDNYDIYTNKGIILSLFYKLIMNISKEDIFLLYKFVNLINVYINLKKQLDKYNFTEAEYITNAEKPEITIIEMFNPVCKNPVTNSITLFSDAESSDNEGISQEKYPDIGFKNCILSGPNGSGKSTFLKSITTSIILAQTIGYVPAERCKLTPFIHISTYLNIPDCIGKESLFQAEMKRCYEHINKLKKLDNQSQAFSFNIMDEIFVSTNYQEGVSGAWAVMKNIAKYKNAVSIITTHFDKCLETTIKGYVYKHFTLNNLDSSYKLLDGINDKHCAIALLEKYGFDEELISDANKIYNSK